MPELESSPESPSSVAPARDRVRIVQQTLETLGKVDRAKARAARKSAHKLSEWTRQLVALEYSLFEHRGHPKFRMYDDAWKRELSFKCNCKSGKIREHIGLVALRSSPSLMRAVAGIPRMGLPVRSSDYDRQAELRARALLHQFLTREQRWSLRASHSFLVTGQDGQTYEVGEGSGVRLLVNGKPVRSFCIHPREILPPCDVMLAQKLLLESNIEHFLATANVTEIRRTGT